MRAARSILIALVLLAAVPASAADMTPHSDGPDIPPLTEPDAVVVSHLDERYECAEGARAATIDVPAGDWDRIILTFSSTPDGDPWDRIFGVSIGGVEVLRGTTPRTPFTIHRDITEYAVLLPPGEQAEVALYIGSWVGALKGSVTLSFYGDEPTGDLVTQPRADVVPGFTWRRLNGDGQVQSVPVTFDAAPGSATVEITLSGHSTEEFWYQSSPVPRAFEIDIDGVQIGVARAMPYVYALFGFGNDNANTACVGPGTSAFGDTVHPVMWWSAHQVLDVAGIHTGNGQIPAYRAAIAPEHLALLTGERTLTVTQVGGRATWVTSVDVLLD